MRIMLPGIEVIFGFLLTVPFTERFTRLTSLQTSTYFSVFIATALATALLVAPSAYHRLRWRQYDKEHLLRVANKFAIAGLAFFAFALSGMPSSSPTWSSTPPVPSG
jgi:predicted membrane channel-forming protein YqfA (hemolysin III family)